MRYGVTEVVDRQTKLSSRSLMVLSFVVIAGRFAGVDFSTLSIANVRFTEDQIGTIAVLLLILLSISHLVAWVGNLLSLRRWVIEIDGKKVEIFWGGRKPLKGELALVVENIGYQFKDDDKRTNEQLADRLSELRDEVASLRNLVIGHDLFAAFVVYVWHLVVPMAFSLWAIYLGISNTSPSVSGG